MSIADILPLNAESNIDTRMDYRWIDLRDEKKVFMFRIQREKRFLDVHYVVVRFYKRHFHVDARKLCVVTARARSKEISIPTAKNLYANT